MVKLLSSDLMTKKHGDTPLCQHAVICRPITNIDPSPLKSERFFANVKHTRTP